MTYKLLGNYSSRWPLRGQLYQSRVGFYQMRIRHWCSVFTLSINIRCLYGCFDKYSEAISCFHSQHLFCTNLFNNKRISPFPSVPQLPSGIAACPCAHIHLHSFPEGLLQHLILFALIPEHSNLIQLNDQENLLKCRLSDPESRIEYGNLYFSQALHRVLI